MDYANYYHCIYNFLLPILYIRKYHTKFIFTIWYYLILLFILINIVFDVVGMAVTSADEKVFHSMNSRKVRGANIAVKMVKKRRKSI